MFSDWPADKACRCIVGSMNLSNCWFNLHLWHHVYRFTPFHQTSVRCCGIDRIFRHCESTVSPSVDCSTRKRLGLDVTPTATSSSTSDWWKPWVVWQSDTATLLWSATLFLTYSASSLAPAHSLCLQDYISVCRRYFGLVLAFSLVAFFSSINL